MLRNLKSFNPPEIEEKVLNLWKEKQIFEKTLKPKKGAKIRRFNFWEGPPSANGRPGIHHVLSRVFKDVFVRYATMQGFTVSRKAGWDTHGLPIEIETEKTLGIKSKKEIEQYGIKEFNQKAQEVVWKYKDEWEKITERIGYWLDMKNPYITCDYKYIESLWWVFSELNKKGFLKESYKVTPYCPRCQTALAHHELGQPGVYKTVPDPSVYLKFALKGKKNEYLLVWTTTPWTLSANVAVAVLSSGVYHKYKIGNDFVWAMMIPEKSTQGQQVEKIETIKGSKMIGWEYEPIIKYPHKINLPIKNHTILAADFVSTDDGTGLVHIAPSFGDEDFNLVFGKKSPSAEHILPKTVENDGTVSKGIIGEGMFVKQADDVILEQLKKENKLFFLDKVEHEYPFCWRCSTALIYFARKSWYFEETKVRDVLVKENQKVNWIPGHIKDGRFGEWLAQIKDWAISRERYWGTPLPIWRCDKCEHITVVGGLADLNTKRVSENKYFILRHGETNSILEGWLATGKEVGKFISKMTPKGIKQIQKSAKELSKKKIDIIYASPYMRIKEVCEILAEHIDAKIIFDDRLKEINCGVWNHKSINEFHKIFDNRLERFSKAPEEGETLNDVKKRVYEFIREIDKKHTGENVLIVGHGDPLWMLESAVKHLNNQETLDMSYISTGTWREIGLDNYPTDDLGNIDIHRPYADNIQIKCDKCKNPTSRILDVADVWFDSGAMPYAQEHFPFEKKSGKTSKTPEIFPADYICEGIDQTRGWFHTLMAISVMLGLGAPYKNVISLGLVMDKNGQKMSKSKGNVVDPWSLIHKYGVDAIRWYFYTLNDPGEFKNFDELEVGKTLRGFMMVVYNSLVFLQMYGKDKLSLDKIPTSQNVLDRWIVSRLAEVSVGVKKSMDGYDIVSSGKAIESFIDDLSRWYIRRSRRRLQKPENKKDWETASAVLAYVLLKFSIISAPFVPFFSEALYQSLKKSYKFSAKDSVHLENWPKFDAKVVDSKLSEAMKEARDISSFVLAKRAELQIKVRQPLSLLTIKNIKLNIKGNKEVQEVIKDEINIKHIIFDKNLSEEYLLDTNITPELKAEGIIRECTRIVQDLRQSAGCVPKDSIVLYIDTAPNLKATILPKEKELAKEVGAKKIEFIRTEKFDAEIDTKIDGLKAWVAIKKI